MATWAGDVYGDAPSLYNAEEGDAIADVLLEIDSVTVTEITAGVRTAVLSAAPLMVLSLMPTAEELEAANAQLGLPPGTIASDASATGKPFVVVLVGAYKLPLGPYIPALQLGPRTFTFVVGSTFIEIVLDPSTPAEDCDALPFIIGTYGAIRVHPKLQRLAAEQRDRTLGRAAAIPANSNAADVDSNDFVSIDCGSGTQQKQKKFDCGGHLSPPVESDGRAAIERSVLLSGDASAAGSPYSPTPYVPLGSTECSPNTNSYYTSAPVGTGTAAVCSVAGTYAAPASANSYNYGEYTSSAGPTAAGYVPAGALSRVPPSASPSSANGSVRSGGPALSTRVAARIAGVGVIAASVVAAGSSVLASSLHAGTNLFVSRTRPCAQPLNVPPHIRKRLEVTRKLTKGAAVVTGAVATSAISVAAVVGSAVGTTASELLAGDDKNPDANPRGRAAMEVGSAVFTTGALVFSSLLDAKTTILTATGENITKVVTHKLGAEAGGVSGNAVGIAGDALAATVSLKGGFKKRVALAAAKTAVAHHDQQQKQQMVHNGLVIGGGGGSAAPSPTNTAYAYAASAAAPVAGEYHSEPQQRDYFAQ